jgi:hypothetical protein
MWTYHFLAWQTTLAPIFMIDSINGLQATET